MAKPSEASRQHVSRQDVGYVRAVDEQTRASVGGKTAGSVCDGRRGDLHRGIRHAVLFGHDLR